MPTSNETSDKILGLSRWGRFLDVIVAGIAITGAIGSLFVLPYRVAQLETKAADMEAKRQADHDVLIEIRDDVKYLKGKDGKTRSPRGGAADN